MTTTKRPNTVTLDQIPHRAKAVAAGLRGGEIFALIGPLGSGKTTFVQAVGRALKLKHKITSPTFILLQGFNFKIGPTKAQLYHLDLYRTKNFNEVKALGLEDFWGQANTVTFIEWADKITKHLPKKSKKIYFSHLPKIP